MIDEEKFVIFRDKNGIYKLKFVYNHYNELISIDEFILENGEFKKMGKTYTEEHKVPLQEIKMGLIEMYVNSCDIIFIKGDNEELSHKCSRAQNSLHSDLGHTLHLMRIVLHQLSVQAVGYENWNRFNHNVPIEMFCPALEELIDNAVDVGNWATIENYDPIDSYGDY